MNLLRLVCQHDACEHDDAFHTEASVYSQKTAKAVDVVARCSGLGQHTAMT